MSDDDEHRRGQRLDRITVRGISAFGYHGVLAEEREAGQQFSVDVTLHLDVTAAAGGDDLTRTVNYADVAADVVAVLTGPPVDLIETVAAMIAQRALAYDGVEAVDVTVHKPYAPIPVPFTDVTVQVHRRVGSSPVRRETSGHGGDRAVVLALGANLGDARATLSSALTELAHHPRVTVREVSPLVRSAAVVLPGTPPQPDYLNAVAVLGTDLGPRELLALCQGIELGHGRRRTERWGPRPLDLDLVASGELEWADADLVLPHPRAHERTFVLAPWACLEPAAELPGHGRVTTLLAALPDDLEWLPEPWWTAEDGH